MQSTPVYVATFVSGAVFTGKKGRGVRLTAAHTVSLAGAAPDDIIGVLDDEPAAAGRECAVRILGSDEVIAGAPFAAGAKLTTDANGAWVAAAAAGKYFAIACEAATAAGDIVEALLIRGSAA